MQLLRLSRVWSDVISVSYQSCNDSYTIQEQDFRVGGWLCQYAFT